MIHPAKTWINTRNLILLIFVAVTWINFNQERWLKPEVLSDDVAHYYSYLPSLFYENDLRLNFLSDQLNQTQEARYYAPNRTEEGKPVIKMSMGLALGYLPFFGLAHVSALLSGFKTDGFSTPYEFAIQFSSLIYYLLGIFILSRLLRRYFNEVIVVIVLFAVTFGTNVFYYLTIRAGNVHPFDFFLVSFYLYFCDNWRQNTRLKDACMLGLFLGLLTVTRPINILFALMPFLTLATPQSTPFTTVKTIFNHWRHFLLAVFFFLLPLLPQFIYWHMVTGQFVYNSYVNERFYFSQPHVLDGLFSFRKGWLVYTPLMFLPLAGFFFLNNQSSVYRWALWVLTPVYVYVVFSWWCWWYGGSFGQRALIDIYPLLCIPFCALVYRAQNFRTKAVSATVITLLILLNLFQTMQAKYNIIHYDSMTWAAYKRFFLIDTGIPDREKYLQHPDYGKALRGEDEY